MSSDERSGFSRETKICFRCGTQVYKQKLRLIDDEPVYIKNYRKTSPKTHQ